MAEEVNPTETINPTPAPTSATAANSKAVTITSKQKTHKLQEGEQLWRIATAAGVSLKTLIKYNDLQGKKVKPGMVLQLP